MLRNEFPVLGERFEQTVLSPQLLVAEMTYIRSLRIRQSWEDAILSEATEHCLMRYFYYQLELIVKLSDSISETGNLETTQNSSQEQLLHLTDHLETYYSCYLNRDAVIPQAYWHNGVRQQGNTIAQVKGGMRSPFISLGFRQMFSKCIDDVLNAKPTISYTFRFSRYFFSLIKKLADVDFHAPDAEEQVIETLILNNFNHLSFFVFLQERLSNAHGQEIDKLSALYRQKQMISSRPEALAIGYDQQWPSIKVMLNGWLAEEIVMTEHLIKDAADKGLASVPKILTELPLTHMAYLTRLFVEENVYGNLNLKGLFKFYAEHFQTKRQPAISPGGFSKAYYSADQQTAARVKALLEKMLSRIKRDFFPVVVAVSVTAHFFPGMH